jgi:RNA polymerase sigma-70 factor (ECF subfamily)
VADDRELWERVCRGDTGAFDRFYQENVSRLSDFLRQLLGNRQAAEDVAQEAFLQLWHKPNGFHPENGSLRAYLFGIGRKRAAEWWRQQKSTADEQELGKTECETETSSLVEEAFSKLGAEQRSLLWLKIVEGQSYAELAEILEIPVGTVKSRLFAAREEWRRIWHGASAGKRVAT